MLFLQRKRHRSMWSSPIARLASLLG
jgi:hypothetical protein